MSNKQLSKSEKVVFTGRLFELVHQEQPDGRNFEIARRAPGVRLIITDEVKRQVLLTREFRQELQDWDYRLPGGKVFDSLAAFDHYRRTKGDIVTVAAAKAKAEGQEEAGITIEEMSVYKVSTLGATVEWDLYIFEAKKWTKTGEQALEAGEIIETDHWFNYDEVEAMILNGEMREERIALVLLQWLHKQITNDIKQEKATEFIIAQPVVDDAEEIATMHGQSWLDVYPNDEHGVSLEYVTNKVKERSSEDADGLPKRRSCIRESYTNPDYFFRIAKDPSGKIVGFVDGRVEDGGYELGGLYIDKKMYGSGLAQKLWEQFLDWAHNGQSDIRLSVATYNKRAHAFYKKVGFEIVPDSESRYDNTLPIIDMIRKGIKL